LHGEISVSISVRGVRSNSVVLAIAATESSLAFFGALTLLSFLGILSACYEI